MSTAVKKNKTKDSESANKDEEQNITQALAKAEAWDKLANDKDLHDMTLEGNDGAKVSACRCILAARSDVFKRMLFGSFSEASSKDTIKIDFDGPTLQSLVDFIHSEAAPKWEEPGDNATTEAVVSQVASLCHLAQAASYFDLPGLEELIETLFEKKAELSLWIISPELPFVKEETKALAWKNIRTNKNNILLDERHVPLLPLDVMETILKDEQLAMDEIHLFNMLDLWKKKSTDRNEQAKGLCKQIRLDLLPPDVLSLEVEESGLADQKQLLEAYKKFATSVDTHDEQKYLPLMMRRRCLEFPYPAAPPKLRVCGAGSSVVNGIYVLSGDSNGACIYQRFGKQNGKPYLFEIEFNDSLYWDLSGFDSKSDDWIDMYSVSVEKKSELPPTDGWEIDSQDCGEAPAPSISFLEAGDD